MTAKRAGKGDGVVNLNMQAQNGPKRGGELRREKGILRDVIGKKGQKKRGEEVKGDRRSWTCTGEKWGG